jgi:nucleotide-binding universal stress UspA family protein
MDRKTARKYQSGKLPSERAADHEWRTREDPFAEVWHQVVEQLEANAGLQAKTLFQWLQRTYPGRFQDGQLRTFQRGVKRWRATRGPQKEVFFGQVHQPGRLCASDFTFMNELQVTIQGRQFDHLLYHFVLTYSNWEWATICFSESFESLSEGLQESLWQLGGAPDRHRSDRMSAAVNNLSDRREFTQRYQALTNHYRLTMEKTNPRQAHENGDIESLHRHLKKAIEQALLLRGSRDFESREVYETLLHEVLAQKNAGRRGRLEEELPALRPLPARRLESYKRVRVQVDQGSLIRVQKNVYSVHSRLIGEDVDVRVYADHLEVRYAQRQIEELPRLRGTNKHHINYRHVIDWLVRKPGAFENYRYRDDLFPTSRFRMAYDDLRERHASGVASRQYLKILELAARENETAVDDALRLLLDAGVAFEAEQVEQLLREGDPVRPVTEVIVDEPDLISFDCLLEEQEVLDGCEQGRERNFDWSSAGAASPDVP